MQVSSLKFRAFMPVGENHMLPRDVEFKLGLGPCGRFVEFLESIIGFDGVTITQVSYPEDYGHIKETWQRLHDTNITNMNLIVGTFLYTGGPATKGHGYGNLEYMTPTKEEHEANIKLASEFNKKRMALHDQRETKVFFYKLEDVRGRIVAIRL